MQPEILAHMNTIDLRVLIFLEFSQSFVRRHCGWSLLGAADALEVICWSSQSSSVWWVKCAPPLLCFPRPRAWKEGNDWKLKEHTPKIGRGPSFFFAVLICVNVCVGVEPDIMCVSAGPSPSDFPSHFLLYECQICWVITWTAAPRHAEPLWWISSNRGQESFVLWID